MTSAITIAKKIYILRTVYGWGKAALKANNKSGSGSKVDVSGPNIKAEVEIDKLRKATKDGHSLRIKETTFFQLIKDDQIDPNLKYEVIKSGGKVDPIDVMAIHDGTYLIIDGEHRAAIACALEFDKVPVRVISLDKKLLHLLEMLRDTYPNKGQKALYIPINHPVFSDWHVDRDHTRWILIKDEFDWTGKRILDIGSSTGYFSHKIAGSGGYVTGIDINKKRLNQARMVNTLLESNVEFTYANFFEYLQDKRFDCIIFFSVLHWILKDKGLDGVREALEIISSSSPLMFFDMGPDSLPNGRIQEWLDGLAINKATIPDLIISNSKYGYFKHLGTGDTGREVFKFGREPL